MCIISCLIKNEGSLNAFIYHAYSFVLLSVMYSASVLMSQLITLVLNLVGRVAVIIPNNLRHQNVTSSGSYTISYGGVFKILL